MYVDKKLSGVKAVQTLSRLNRTYAGKEDTFVLDFVNDRQTILESFQPYYELTTITENPDPDLLYDQKNRLENSRVFWPSEVEAFCNIFFASPDPIKSGVHARLNAHIDPAVDRFRHLATDEERDEFKRTLTGFIHLYSFFVQIMPFEDMELEKLFAFCKFLLRKLPHGNLSDAFRLGDEVALEYYRLQKISEGSIVLETQGEYGLNPPTEVGLSRPKEEKEHLSVIIDLLNDTFGTDFTEADKLFFDQIETVLMDNNRLAQQAQNNSMDNFRYGFEEAFMTALIERMGQNEEIFQKIMRDENGFGEVVRAFFLKKMYHKFRE